MKFAFVTSAACLVALPSSVLAQAANERSALWLCRSSEGYSCIEGKGCKFIPAELLKIVDFRKMTVNDFASKYSAKISGIEHFISSYSPAATYFHAGMSQSFVILDRPAKEIGTDSAYPFRLVNASASGGQNTYFGTCSPQG